MQTETKTDDSLVELDEVVVQAERPLSAASSKDIRARDYELRPHATTFEILNSIPGLIVNQHQGGAKAPQYLIRGFDADHGTDFAVFVDDVPVNLVSHAHGQGYADTSFIIPETVDRLELYKGPYFADLGDFTVAGALKIVTLDELEENFARAEGGSFDTQRYVLGGSAPLSWAKTLLAAEAYYSNGPFENEQNLARYNVFGKLTLEPTKDHKLSFTASVYDGDWDGSGQIPLREVSAGRLDRFGAIDPTEGGKSDRENLNLQYTYKRTPEEELHLQVYGSRYSLRLYSNFTFFQETGNRFLRQADGSICDTAFAGCDLGGATFIPGDGITQDDARLLFGGNARYTRYWSAGPIPMRSQIGLQTRRDDADVALLRQVRRNPFFTVNKVDVAEQSVSGYLQQQVLPASWLRLEVGLRGDVFFFDVRDRLPARAPDPRDNFQAERIEGNDTDSVWSPKANLILTPVENTDVYLNFGEGYHSNDARVVVNSDRDALADALGYELGARTHQLDRIDVAAALWLVDLESELVFSGDAGTFEPSGPTRRWGVDFETRVQALDWLFFDYDLTYSDPRFRTNGDAVPLAPTLLMNGGITMEFPNGFSAAMRVRFVDDRPATEDRALTARGYTLLDLLAKYRWRNVEASIGLLNILDRDWREAQFGDPSCVASEVGVDPRCPVAGSTSSMPAEGVTDIHFTPGNPFGARGGLTVYF